MSLLHFLILVIEVALGSMVHASGCGEDFLTQSDSPVRYEQMAERGGRTLYYSSVAIQNAKLVDALIADQPVAVEIAAVGLTRSVGSKLFVEDFVVPDPNRILTVGGLFLSSPVLAILDTLEHSDDLVLALDGEALALMSRELSKTIRLDEEEYQQAEQILGRLIDGQVRGAYAEALTLVRAHGQIRLRTDWELLIRSGRCLLTEMYWQRVRQIAEARGLETRANMHHHPQFSFAVAVLSGREPAAQLEYLDALLEPSPSDLRAMDAYHVDWFEIRSFGTVGNLTSRGTSARFFNMVELRDLKTHLTTLIELILKPVKSEDSLEIEKLRHGVSMFERWLTERNLSRPAVLEYLLGTERMAEVIKNLQPQDQLTSERDRLMNEVFRR